MSTPLETKKKMKKKFKKIFPFLVFLGILFSLIAFTDLFNAKEAEAGWYATGGTWGYRKAITIDHTKVPDTDASNGETDFPVLIDVTDSDLASNAKTDGFDILFTSSDGTTKLSHEREIYTTATGRLTAWVKVPALSSTVDTTIYMYYGNSGASDQQDATGAWDSNYRAVWHMGESATPAVDSKNSISLAEGGTGTLFNQTGKIGTAVNGDGTNDELTAAHTANLNIATTLTMSAWLKVDDYGEAGPIIQKRGQTTYCDTNYNYGFFISQTDGYPLFEYGASCSAITDNSSAIGTGSWVYLTVVVNETDDTVKFYRNGNQSNSLAYTGTMPAAGTAPIDVMGYSNTDFTTYNMDGSMDELRMAATARSADWIVTEYNNQSATSTFYSIEGSPVANATGGIRAPSSSLWYNASWGYAKKITIDHTKVSGSVNLNDFPVLISLTEADLRTVANGGYVGKNDGTDILFVGENGNKLDHEIEIYTPTTGELVAWVKAPALYPVNNTNIIMYFGNAGASDQQNITGVWDSNYRAVWHWGSTSTLSTEDSTANNFDMSNSGVVVGTGKINGAGVFDDYDNITLSTSILDTSGAFTISGWFTSTNLNAYHHIFGRATDSNNLFAFFLGSGGTLGSAFIASGNQVYPGNSTALSINTWYYFAITAGSGVTTASVYVNTSKSDTSVAANTRFSGGTPKIGYDSADTFLGTYTGSMDEIRVSNSVRSSDWIATEYANQSATSTFYTIGTTLTPSTIGEASTPPTTKVKVRGGVKFR